MLGATDVQLSPLSPTRLLNYICRTAVHQFLTAGICKGSLTLIDRAAGSEHVFGQSAPSARASNRPVARLTLHNGASFYARIAATADIGFAEAYIAGDFSVAQPDDLTSIFRLLIVNRDQQSLSASRLLLSRLGASLNTLLHALNRNTISGSQRNIEAHYDLSNQLFATFLGDSWTYSCALFDEAQPRSLDGAQRAKIERIIDKARITRDCHVLEIGCGWGELAIRAALRTGCRVTGITLSKEQLALAEKRADAAGVADRVRFVLLDYRRVGELGQRFDRIVSVEMMEAIGHEFLGAFFEALDGALDKDGLVVVQVITTPEERYEEYRRGTDFIQKHIFPGGICPSFQAIVNGMAQSSSLGIEHVENIGVHYATTLKEWRRRFLQSCEEGKVREAGFDELFVRKWVYYLCYCEAGFETRTLGVLQIVLSRPNNTETLGVGGVCEK